MGVISVHPSDRLCSNFANVLRGLVIDAIQLAGSGHPGMPMGMADVAAVLWNRHLKHNPADPSWIDRDRFVLSSGHGSTLLYGLLYLTGYQLPLQELKRHRQLKSMTPGHPERGRTPGVEVTTGPLGQGFAVGVGMALSEAHLSAHYNRPGFEVVNHLTYGIVSDGDLQEGISHEAASIAGFLRLGKLIYFYDDNRMTIDGPTSISCSDDVSKRFEAYGWHVQRIDGHDVQAIDEAIRKAQAAISQPSLIICKTVIARGSPSFQDTKEGHGSPLGLDEVRLTKQALGLPPEESFHVPLEVRQTCEAILSLGIQLEKEWEGTLGRYKKAHPKLAESFERATTGVLCSGWEAELPVWEPGQKVSPRTASGAVLDRLSGQITTLVGGSADLSASTKTRPIEVTDLVPENMAGTFIHYGIREHAMAAIMNGLAVHGGTIPYGGTYLVFSDYMRPAVRMAAMMGAPVIYVWTHDSISVGEDGPTHQPVEHIAALRCIPGLVVLRPADANETVGAWHYCIVNRERPVALLLARHDLPVLPGTREAGFRGVSQGAYILRDASNSKPEIVIVATGSEVSIALEAVHRLGKKGTCVRVVSMPSWELFEQQPHAYKESILPANVTKRLSVEAGVTMGWERYVGIGGTMIGVNRFGESGKGSDVMSELGITADRIVEEILKLLGSSDS
jgi:transketolase